MLLENYYWYFKSAVPSRICDDIVKYGNQLKRQTALTGNDAPETLNKKQVEIIKKKRDSNIVWLNDRWVYNEVQPYIYKANRQAGWNFEWDWSEACQFTKYEKGQHYGWHSDYWIKPYQANNKNDPAHGKIRKLSATISLTDPKNYKGGELEFDFRNLDPDKPNQPIKCTKISAKGSIIVFPSFVWHRVCPVTSGERNSLVIWSLGYPFK